MKRLSSRREFFGTMAGGAAALSLRPVFSPAGKSSTPDGTVHINYNESPYGPPDKALKAIRESAASLAGRYYEDSSYEELSKTLARFHGLSRDTIQVGAGSTEILKICDDVFLHAGKRLVVAEPAYEAVIQYAVNSQADALKIPLTHDYRHDLMKMADAINHDTGMVYICNPNNPTGTIVNKVELQRFMDRVPSSVTVVVDEAYSHFVTNPDYESALYYVHEGRNVIVARTFSKIFGMAGMRVGYAVARKDLIDKIRPYTVDYSITGVAATAAMSAINDSQHVEHIAKLNAANRQLVFDEMKKLKFECTASESNFLMINIKKPVGPVIQEFEKRKVLVGREFPAMPTFLRVTIGTEDEMKKFFVAFREILRA
jgi:histidinol-phosphate aminotransferase